MNLKIIDIKEVDKNILEKIAGETEVNLESSKAIITEEGKFCEFVYEEEKALLVFAKKKSFLNLLIKKSISRIIIFAEDDSEINILVNKTDNIRSLLANNCKCKIHFSLLEEGNITVENIANGNESRLDIEGLVINKKEQEANIKVQNSFKGENNQGIINIKSAALDNSKQKLDGMIYIGSKGGKTDSYLKIDSVILGEKAKVRALPNLEINTNDVKAGHGASISKFKDEDLFYLMSRGLTLKDSQKLILEGMIEAFIDSCKHSDSIKAEFRTLVNGY